MAGSSDELTRSYLDKFAICWQHIGGCEATTETEFFGHKLETPIMSGGMAHYQKLREGGAVEFAQGVKAAGTVMWTGFCPDEDMEKLIAVGAPAVRIIKPFADEKLVLSHIEHDAKAGAAAFSMDIDHVFDKKGRIGEFFGHPYAPQTVESLRKYAHATDLPFVVKGVLSVEDAVSCAEAGVQGILLSHHQNMFPWSVPPLAVLPEIRKAVGNDMMIIADCGIETGYEAFKALALGADAVCVARPLRPIFAEGGPDAVKEKLEKMTDELRVCLSKTASVDIHHISPNVLKEL